MGPHPRPFLGVGQVEPLWLHVENGLGQGLGSSIL